MFKLNLICALLLVSTQAFGQSSLVTNLQDIEKKELQKVIVKGGQTDLEASRDFAAGKLVIGRKQIADSGLQNAAELLKREPAITIGKDGRIGLIGLPGYTQILLNGQISTGKNPLELDVAEIERIEIIKSSTAETGPFGIAGSINVISKKTERKKSQQLSAGMQDAAGIYGVNGAWSINDANIDSPWQWRLSITANQRRNQNPVTFTQTQIDRDQKARLTFDGSGIDENIVEFGNIVSGIVYRFNDENTLSMNPALGYFQTGAQNQERRIYEAGRLWNILGNSSSRMLGIDLPISWSREVGDNVQMNVDFKLSQSQLISTSNNSNLINALPAETSKALSDDDETSYRINFNYKQSINGGHEITTGLLWSKSEGTISNRNWFNDKPDLNLLIFGELTRLRNEARRLFLQDEWRVNKAFAVNAGLSVEDKVSEIREGSEINQARYRVWSPSFHLSKKISSDIKRQFRFSIARSFKAPDLSSLMVRPVINVLAPCYASSVCERNTLDTIDTAGNPSLQVERALSLNVSYEHGLSEDSQVSFDAYVRQIEQKFGRDISLETVAWSSAQRYVERPANLGNAQIYGASVDWRIALRDLWQAAPKIEIRGSIGRARSTINNLPAPYNHLEGQTPWRAKFGMTYDATGLPLKFNVDASWLPSDWIRNNLVQKTYESRHASYSANLVWVTSKAMKWSISLNNLFAPTKYKINAYQSGGGIQRQSAKSSYAQLGVRLELKL